MQRVNERNLAGRPRPTERIIQFGEGNFLRAFMDWKIDRMNEETSSDYGVVIVRPIDGGVPASLNDSDGVYTVLSRGVGPDGDAISDARLISAVRREMNAATQWDDVLALARNTDFVAVISNTTEAGIVYNSECKATDTPPASYPAKVTRMLLERFTTCGETDAPGFHFLPCELIDKNGDNLERIVKQHAQDWDLGEAFVGWLEEKNAFYNTLVDRIVPGFPRDEVERLETELGYHDPLMVTAELFHFLVIEKRDDQPDLVLPMADKDAGTVIVQSADGYKERKVAILNGAHTGLCPLALLSGTISVKDAMENDAASRFLKTMLETEIIPYLSLPREELDEFSAEVLRRFANPFILHRWYDISLNGLAKFRTRNLPRFESARAATGTPPRCMSLSLAAWLAFYVGDFAASGELPPRDAGDVIERMVGIGAIKDRDGVAAMVRAFLADETLWGRSLATDDLVVAVSQAYEFLTTQPFNMDQLVKWIEAS